MTIRLTLPVREQTKTAAWSAIHASVQTHAMTEVWLACIRDLDMAFIDQLIAAYAQRLVLVVRPPPGQRTRMTPDMKSAILARAGTASVLVDLDLLSEQKDLRVMRQHSDWPRIVSCHDMEKTPDDRALRTIIRTMEPWQPTICKIAALCRTPEDGIRLLSLLLSLRKRGVRCIILGMGPFGTPTRIFGALWGNDMIFAPEHKEKQSAPGQLTRTQLETILHILKGA